MQFLAEFAEKVHSPSVFVLDLWRKVTMSVIDSPCQVATSYGIGIVRDMMYDQKSSNRATAACMDLKSTMSDSALMRFFFLQMIA